MDERVVDHEPEHVNDRTGRCGGQAAAPLGHADPSAGEPGHGEDREAPPQVARHGGGGEDGRSVAVEGQGGDEPHAVELHGRPQRDPRRHRRAVDLGPQRGSRGGEQELQLGQALEGDGGLPAHGVVRREHDDQVLVEELGRHDLVAAEREGDHGQVELARGQLLLQLHAGALGHVEVDVGVAHPEEIEQLGHQPPARRADHAEAHRPDHLFAQRGHVGHHRVELVHHPAGPLDHDVALFGQSSRRPVDELHVELPLQARHMGRHVGLHRADGGRRRREAPRVGDAQECLQVFQFHRESPPSLLARVRLLISITDMKYLLKLLD